MASDVPGWYDEALVFLRKSSENPYVALRISLLELL